MPRCPHDEHRTLVAFADWLEADPDAGFVVATIQPGTPETGGLTRMGDVGCSPVELLLFACRLLDLVSDQLRAGPASEVDRRVVGSIETALAALGVRATEIAA
ncbi:hypothetical protein [Methylobacterium sp. WSM2598]|uniref:hypothetical protein n=1 Tax=Methylobacterium sp. WSM2598 TaxID=398261 RepID=UPI00037E6579|nr:hypothetical protein [Methylobacterium sp. WSM2598]